MGRPVLYGAAHSCYVRIARLALCEKGVAYDLVPVDIFAPGGPPAWYGELQPFGWIPALEHAAFRLYETAAITRYIDEAFAGPPLQPTDTACRATMTQLVCLLDAYAYRTLVWDVHVERVDKPASGANADETRILAALPEARRCLAAVERLRRPGAFLLGEAPTLADIHLAPMLGLFVQAPEGAAVLAEYTGLVDWWHSFRVRPTIAAAEIDVA